MKLNISSPIWNHRIQILWIAFTAFYITTGAFFSHRWISSVMITIGALLVLLINCHILHETIIDKARPTLLLAFASCLFLAQESTKVYKDDLGTIFSIIIGLSCGITAWVDDEKLMESLKTTVFSVLIFLITTSVTQLSCTVSIKKLITYNLLPQCIYIISPHTFGIMLGIFIGFSFGTKLIDYSDEKINATKIIMVFVTIYLVTISVNTIFNLERLKFIFKSPFVYIPYTLLYTLFPFLIITLAVSIFIKKRNIFTNLINKRILFLLIMPMLLILANSTVNFIFIKVISNIDISVIESLMSEFISFYVVSVALYGAILMIKYLSDKILLCRTSLSD